MIQRINVTNCFQKHNDEKLLGAVVNALATNGTFLITKDQIYELMHPDNSLTRVVFDENIEIIDPFEIIQSDELAKAALLRAFDQSKPEMSFRRERVYRLNNKFYCFNQPFVRTKSMDGKPKIGVIVYTQDTLPFYIECERDNQGYIQPNQSKVSYSVTEHSDSLQWKAEAYILYQLNMLPRRPIKIGGTEFDPGLLYLIHINYGEVDFQSLLDVFQERKIFFNEAQFLMLAENLMNAVETLHKQYIVHNALIPSNIVVQDLLFADIQLKLPNELMLTRYTFKIVNMSAAERTSDSEKRMNDVRQLGILLQRLLMISTVNCNRNELQKRLANLTRADQSLSALVHQSSSKTINSLTFLPPAKIADAIPVPRTACRDGGTPASSPRNTPNSPR